MLKIATLNVHGGLGPRLRGLLSLLAGLDVDVLCLQECASSLVPLLEQHLGASWSGLWAPATYNGNALLSRLPLADGAALVLRSSHLEARSAALASVSGPRGPVLVCCTHLDHVSAAARLEQWADLQARVPALVEGVLCGDLNALTRSDYTDARWAAIAAERAASRWEPPQTVLTDALHAAGFRDAAEGHPVGSTSRFGTRVDYVFLGPRCPLAVTDHRIVDGVAISDHNAVIVTLA